jgi:competence protein ComEC
MRRVPCIAWIAGALALGSLTLQGAKTLDLYFIDTEGGQATLIVAPSGQSLLVDTGYAGNGGRDALRIAAAAKAAGVKHIDNLLITHFHADHAGGVKNLLEKFSVANFYDKGVNSETNSYPAEYSAAISKAQHKVIAPGDPIPVKDLKVTVVAAAGKNIAEPGEPNSFCPAKLPLDNPKQEEWENNQSAAILVEFGKFRFLDPGDLLYGRELSLLCPQNLLGTIDVYLTAHHGAESPAALAGTSPRVAVMNNGARKGGKPEAWRRLHAIPGLADLWQLHFAVGGGSEANSPDTMIANVDEQDEGKYLKLSALPDGSFTVLNTRNKYTKTYGAR